MASNQDNLAVRDFIYLDVERVRSIYAQIEKGVVETRSSSSGSDKSAHGGLQGKIPLLASGEVATDVLWRRGESETISLHDHMFNYVEQRLLETSALVDFNERVDASSWARDSFVVPEGAVFLRISGRARLNDYAQMRVMTENIGELGRALAVVTSWDDDKTPPERRKDAEKSFSEMGLPDKSFTKQLSHLLETFYEDRVVVKIRPFGIHPDCVFVSDVAPQWLRDPVSTVRFRYGSSPPEPWTVVGRLARITGNAIAGDDPSSDVASEAQNMDEAIDGLFDGLAAIHETAEIQYPAISLVPLAVYREA